MLFHGSACPWKPRFHSLLDSHGFADYLAAGAAVGNRSADAQKVISRMTGICRLTLAVPWPGTDKSAVTVAIGDGTIGI